MEFSGGAAVYGSGIVTAVVKVQSLTWEIPHATECSQKKKKISSSVTLDTFQVLSWLLGHVAKYQVVRTEMSTTAESSNGQYCATAANLNLENKR